MTPQITFSKISRPDQPLQYNVFDGDKLIGRVYETDSEMFWRYDGEPYPIQEMFRYFSDHLINETEPKVTFSRVDLNSEDLDVFVDNKLIGRVFKAVDTWRYEGEPYPLHEIFFHLALYLECAGA